MSMTIGHRRRFTALWWLGFVAVVMTFLVSLIHYEDLLRRMDVRVTQLEQHDQLQQHMYHVNGTKTTDAVKKDDWWMQVLHVDDDKNVVPDENLLLQDLNLTMNMTCGTFKCFVPSLSRHHHESFGYLIGQRNEKFKTTNHFTLQHLQNGWKLAQELEAEYNGNNNNNANNNCTFRQFAVSPPLVLGHVTNTLVHALNARRPSGHYRPTADKPKQNRMVVQVVRQAPIPHWQILAFHSGQTLRGMPAFVHAIRQLSPTARWQFRTTLQQELDCLWNIILPDHPQLYLDFQFLLDIHGHIWHFDLDRISGNPAPAHKIVSNVQTRFDDIWNQFLQALDNDGSVVKSNITKI